MSEEEIKAAAHECMRHVCDTLDKASLSVDNFNGTYSFEQCIRKGIEKARVSQSEKNQPLTIGFPIPISTQDIQMMSVWSQSLKHFDVSPEHKTAALRWFESYAASEIEKQQDTV